MNPLSTSSSTNRLPSPGTDGFRRLNADEQRLSAMCLWFLKSLDFGNKSWLLRPMAVFELTSVIPRHLVTEDSCRYALYLVYQYWHKWKQMLAWEAEERKKREWDMEMKEEKAMWNMGVKAGMAQWELEEAKGKRDNEREERWIKKAKEPKERPPADSIPLYLMFLTAFEMGWPMVIPPNPRDLQPHDFRRYGIPGPEACLFHSTPRIQEGNDRNSIRRGLLCSPHVCTAGMDWILRLMKQTGLGSIEDWPGQKEHTKFMGRFDKHMDMARKCTEFLKTRPFGCKESLFEFPKKLVNVQVAWSTMPQSAYVVALSLVEKYGKIIQGKAQDEREYAQGKKKGTRCERGNISLPGEAFAPVTWTQEPPEPFSFNEFPLELVFYACLCIASQYLWDLMQSPRYFFTCLGFSEERERYTGRVYCPYHCDPQQHAGGPSLEVVKCHPDAVCVDGMIRLTDYLLVHVFRWDIAAVPKLESLSEELKEKMGVHLMEEYKEPKKVGRVERVRG
ncbi:hypothetical protein NMY22_g14939 [Coprinellus aureogranulatus]|nr:hypothetical protein NMY22_g14939 [Coprinellus aureogranulatus]